MPKNCVVCKIGTESVPFFRVTSDRIKQWADEINDELKISN